MEIDGFPGLNCQHLPRQIFQRYQMIHQTVHSGNHDSLRFLQKPAQHCKPLSDHQVPVNIRTKEQQIFCRIQPDIGGEILKIVVQLSCSGLIISHYQLPGVGCPQFIHKLNLLGIHTPCSLYRAFFPF